VAICDQLSLLLVSRAGGCAGGGAALTPTGHTVIEAFRRIEAEMVRALRTVESELVEASVSPLDLVSGFLIKTSARNAIRGSIVKIVSGALSAEVEISVSLETTIFSLVTHASMEELGLCPGRS
jgi:molybdate transport system regulatory protein